MIEMKEIGKWAKVMKKNKGRNVRIGPVDSMSYIYINS